MNVYEFRSRCWQIRAVTPDRAGNSLPADYAPWDPQNDGAVLSTLTSIDVLYGVLVRYGFFLTSVTAQAARRDNLRVKLLASAQNSRSALPEQLSGR